jgi:hypothetical protein
MRADSAGSAAPNRTKGVVLGNLTRLSTVNPTVSNDS